MDYSRLFWKDISKSHWRSRGNWHQFKDLSLSAELLLLVCCGKAFDGAQGKRYPSQDMISDGQLSEGQMFVLLQVSHKQVSQATGTFSTVTEADLKLC